MSPAVAIALAGAGTLLLIGAVWARWTELIMWGLAALGGSYAVWLVGEQGGVVGLTAPLVAAFLLAVGEAAFHGAGRARGTEYGAREAAWIAAVALLALAVSAVVLLVATIAVAGSLVLTLGGAVAAVIAIALPSARIRRHSDVSK